jgi:DNA-binding beta-propeller fold protein YncE
VIARVNPTTLVTTAVAGGGASGAEGVAALIASIDPAVSKLAFSAAGDLYFTETGYHRIRKVSGLAASPIVTTVIGTGVAGNGADLLAPTATALSSPFGIAFTPDGKLFVADQNNHTVRVIWPPVP